MVRGQTFKALRSGVRFHLATADITSLTTPSSPGDLPDGNLDAATASSSRLNGSGSLSESDHSGITD